MDEFILDENGEIVYEPVEDIPDTGEEDLYGQPIDEIPVEGDSTTDQVEVPEDVPESDEEIAADNPLDNFTADSPLPVALSEELTQALLADTPASGTLGSSTLSYFDRIVSGLSNDYKYVAYRTDDNDSSDGILIYGNHYTIQDGVHITFGKDAVAISVERQDSGNRETVYSAEDAEGWLCTPVQNGSVVYYSNVRSGLPALGGYKPTLDISTLIVVGLLSAMATVILTKLFRR